MQQTTYTQSSNHLTSSQIPRSVQQSHQSSLYHGGTSVGGGSRLITGGATSSAAGPERVQSTRKISSTIVNEQLMGPPPQDYPVREVEVPGPTEEVIRVVPKKMVHETEKRVPKYIYEYVDKIVEVPRVEYVDRIVERVEYQDVPVPRKVVQYVDVPKEVIKEVKVPRVNYVENVVEVPGPVINVPKPYNVQQIVEVNQYIDRKKPVVVAQAVRPIISEGVGVAEVDVYEYEPECIPVDVHVVKGVQAQIQAGGVVETQHKVISVPSAQYNTILKQMNIHLSEGETQKLPYLLDGGSVTFLGEQINTTEVPHGVFVAGLDMQSMTHTWIDQSSRKVQPVNIPQPQYGGIRQAYGQTTARTSSSHNRAASQRISSAGQYNATPLHGPAAYPYSHQGGHAYSHQGGQAYSNRGGQAYAQQGARLYQEQSAQSYVQSTPQPQYAQSNSHSVNPGVISSQAGRSYASYQQRNNQPPHSYMTTTHQ